VIPSNQFFADNSRNSCLHDCEPGPFGCLIAPPLTALYGRIDACCSSLGWIEYKYCASRSVGKYSDGWVVDYQNAKCGESAKNRGPAGGPPCSETDHDDASASIYDTVEACCDRIDLISTNSCVTVSGGGSTS